MPVNRQKADPNLRRSALRYLLLAALAGAAIISVYRALFAWAVADENLMASRVAIIIATLYLPTLPALWICRRLWTLGGAVISSRRFPPPGAQVVRDTAVTTGRSATLRGAVLRAVALMTGITFVVTPLLLWWLLWYVAAPHP